jgi:hypothetical protein
MEAFIEKMIIALFSAIAAIALSWLVQAIGSWLRTKRLAKGLVGEWYSTYQWDEPAGAWVTEKVDVSVPFQFPFPRAQLLFKNKECSHNYNYEAKGLIQWNTIIGDWETTRRGGIARGAFLVTIGAQGDNMYGYWAGTDKSHHYRYDQWFLARTETELPAVKKQLADSMSRSGAPSA